VAASSGSAADPLNDFERDGFVLLPGAIDPALLARLTAACDRVHRAAAPAGGPLHRLGFLAEDPAFCELLDLPAVLDLVRAALGWNVYVYHSHLDVHPPVARPGPARWRWHQDGLRQNLEARAEPIRPRLSVKAAAVLSDLREPGRGNTLVLPGSHHRNTIPRPRPGARRFRQPAGAREVLAAPGTVMLFDRRLWHAATDNRSAVTRKVLFLAYTYRWVRPREDYLAGAPAWVDELSPVRRQLLGAAVTPNGHWEPEDADVPLRGWAG